MCIGGPKQQSAPPASTPAAAPAPAPEAPVAPVLNDATSSGKKVASANQAGRGGFKVDLASGSPQGGSGLNIPV